jgi:hypothetical protein
MTTFTILSTSEFNALANKTAKIGASYDTNMQVLAVNAIAQSIIHNNVTPCNKVLSIMNKSSRKAAMIEYLEHYGYAAFSKTDEKFVFCKIESEEAKEFDGKKLMLISWTSFKAKKPQAAVDIEAMLLKLIKSGETAIINDSGIKHGALLDMVKVALSNYHEELLAHIPDTEEEIAEAKAAEAEEKAAKAAKVTKIKAA